MMCQSGCTGRKNGMWLDCIHGFRGWLDCLGRLPWPGEFSRLIDAQRATPLGRDVPPS